MGLRRPHANISAKCSPRAAACPPRNRCAKGWRAAPHDGPDATGRAWRPLQDTADSAQLFSTTPTTTGPTGAADVDFYEEGALLWLDVDATLRKPHPRPEIDERFLPAFSTAARAASRPIKTYTFDDMVATLNGLAPYDWAKFLRTRLDSVDANTPSKPSKTAAGNWSITNSRTRSRRPRTSSRDA